MNILISKIRLEISSMLIVYCLKSNFRSFLEILDEISDKKISRISSFDIDQMIKKQRDISQRLFEIRNKNNE